MRDVKQKTERWCTTLPQHLEAEFKESQADIKRLPLIKKKGEKKKAQEAFSNRVPASTNNNHQKKKNNKTIYFREKNK